MTAMRPHPINKGGLQQLQQFLFHSSLDPVFIAIDFEGTEFIKNNFSPCSDTQAGISIFDTRSFNRPFRKSTLKLETYNFVTGLDLYYAESAKKFLWGTPEKIPPGKMLKYINKLIRRNRNIVLVGHGVSEDLAVLTSLGFNLKTSIISILDTANVAFELGISRSTLGRLLDELECPKSTARLHNAGNDANFTLRALILLAIKGYNTQEPGTPVEEDQLLRIEALQYVATTPLPGVRHPKKTSEETDRKDMVT
ncbi:hypothetical protein F5884DRAFT_850001 [Xylogone sp. PMI_703]|nr:hypothetical protein F5884DRAFT_850001 [Xylogone sp. PMI_703]